MSPSFRCNYEIFTNNVFSRLVPAANNIDPINGERRAIKIIDKLRLSNAIPLFSREVFGRLIENFNRYEKLQRGIYIILNCSQYPLEIQAASYCVAMEAMASLSSEIIGKTGECIIPDSKRWTTVKDRFMGLIQDLFESNCISVEERNSLEKKIGNMNSNFNAEKLKALLEYFHYPLKKFDYLTLSLRNPLLHGSIQFHKLNGDTADNLFELSMNLHKLCCSIALLLAGYKGYIVNNRNFYGFTKAGTAFIRI